MSRYFIIQNPDAEEPVPKVKIPETLEGKVPEQLKNLDSEAEYRLEKIKAKNQSSMVRPGQAITGTLEVVDVAGEPGIRVSHVWNYIRTSPIVKILDETSTTLTFETEGGVYTLERKSE